MRAVACGLALLLLSCAHLLPASLRPLSPECPGELAPVASLDPARQLQGSYRRISHEGDEQALLIVAERQESELVLAGISAVGVHVFTVVQREDRADVVEHLRPLYPHPPADVLRDLHRVRAWELPPGSPREIETPGCDYRATLTIR